MIQKIEIQLFFIIMRLVLIKDSQYKFFFTESDSF